jgi:hypothetical protein
MAAATVVIADQKNRDGKDNNQKYYVGQVKLHRAFLSKTGCP